MMICILRNDQVDCEDEYFRAETMTRVDSVEGKIIGLNYENTDNVVHVACAITAFKNVSEKISPDAESLEVTRGFLSLYFKHIREHLKQAVKRLLSNKKKTE